MSKQFIVRLRKNGKIVANSQIVTINGLGDGSVSSNDFSDRILRANFTTVSGVASLRKIVTTPGWTLIATNPTINGGINLNFSWSTTRRTVDAISWYAVYPDTTIIYSGPALPNTGSPFNLYTPGTSGSFFVPTTPVGTEQQFQIVLYNGNLSSGTFLARSGTCTVQALRLEVSGASPINVGNTVLVKIKGAPFEVVNYTGETSGQVTLDYKGDFYGSLTSSVTLGIGNYTWTFDGSITDNVEQLTVKITSGKALSVTGPSKVAKGKVFTVFINGEPGDEIKATPSGAQLGQPPLFFYLPATGPSAGSFTADLSKNGNLAIGTYSWVFSGKTSEPARNYQVSVEEFILRVKGPAQALSNSPVVIQISGAPEENVEIRRSGVQKLTKRLLSDGNINVDVNADRSLTSGEYTWEFEGDATFNTPNPTHTVTIVSEYSINVFDGDGLTYSNVYVQGQPINVAIHGAPSEKITVRRDSNNDGVPDVTDRYTFLDAFGSGSINLAPTTLALGNYMWNFTGNISKNRAYWPVSVVSVKNISVTPASPQTILVGERANVIVDGNPYELVTSTRAGSESVDFALDVTGTAGGDLFKGLSPPVGSYKYYFSGTKAPNKDYPYQVNVLAAPIVPVTPSYTVRAKNPQNNLTITSAGEGDSIKFEVESVGPPLNTTLAYTITGIDGNDVTVSSFLSGALVVGDDGYTKATVTGFSSVVLPLRMDELTEGTEYVKFQLTIAPTANVTIPITDTSKSQLAMIVHRGGSNQVREGQAAIFDVTTSNVPNGRILYYRVFKAAGFNEVVALDFQGGSLGVENSLVRGSFTVTADDSTGIGSGSFQFNIASDAFIDADEAFIVQVWKDPSNKNTMIGITNVPISIIDANTPSADFEITNFYILSVVDQCIDAFWSVTGNIIAHEVRYTPNASNYNSDNNYQAYSIINPGNAVFTELSFGPIPVGLQTESGFTHTFRLWVTGTDGTRKYRDVTALIRHPASLVNYGLNTVSNVPFSVNEGDFLDMIVDSNASGSVFITFDMAGQMTSNVTSSALSLNTVTGRWTRTFRVTSVEDTAYTGNRDVNVQIRTGSITGNIKVQKPVTIIEDDPQYNGWTIEPRDVDDVIGGGSVAIWDVTIPTGQRAAAQGQTFYYFLTVPSSTTAFSGSGISSANRSGSFTVPTTHPFPISINTNSVTASQQTELIITLTNSITGTLVGRASVLTIAPAPTITYPTTSTHGTAFTWSIANAQPSEGWYAQTTGAFSARVPGIGYLYVDASGAASYTNGDWGTISPGFTNNKGAVTVTFTFEKSGLTVTKAHTVNAATTTAAPTTAAPTTAAPTTAEPTTAAGTTTKALTVGLCKKSYTGTPNLSSLWGTYNVSFFTGTGTDTVAVDSFSGGQLSTAHPNGLTTNYSIEWTGYFVPNVTGNWLFRYSADDTFVLWLNASADSPDTGNWFLRAKTGDGQITSGTAFTAGTQHKMRIQYAQGTGSSGLNLQYSSNAGTTWSSDLSAIFKFDVCVPSTGTTTEAPSGILGITPTSGGAAFTEISTNRYLIPEGRSFVLSVAGRGGGVNPSMSVPFSLSGAGLTSSDLSPGTLTGTITLGSTLSGGYYVGTTTFTAVSDTTTEGQEAVTFTITSGPLSIVNALLFDIQDTSTGATTAAPTTAEPTTAAPTTAEPTTAGPIVTVGEFENHPFFLITATTTDNTGSPESNTNYTDNFAWKWNNAFNGVTTNRSNPGHPDIDYVAVWGKPGTIATPAVWTDPITLPSATGPSTGWYEIFKLAQNSTNFNYGNWTWWTKTAYKLSDPTGTGTTFEQITYVLAVYRKSGGIIIGEQGGSVDDIRWATLIPSGANPYAGNLQFGSLDTGTTGGEGQPIYVIGYKYTTKGNITRIVIKTKLAGSSLPSEYDQMNDVYGAEAIRYDSNNPNTTDGDGNTIYNELPANNVIRAVFIGHSYESYVNAGLGRLASRIFVYENNSATPTWISSHSSTPSDFERIGGTMSGGGDDIDGNVEPLTTTTTTLPPPE